MEGVASLNIRESQSKKNRFYAGVISLCFFIFFFGCWLGSIYFKYDSCKGDDCKKQSDILKIVAVMPTVLGAVTSSGLMFWIKLYFDEREKQLKRETIKERHELERAIPSEYRYSAEMDFLSIYYLENNDVPDTSYEDFCQKIRGFCDSRGGIREKTQRYIEQHHRETIEEVLTGIKKGFLKDKEVLTGIKKGFLKDENCRVVPFLVLAKEACNHALKLRRIGEYKAWAVPFYEDIATYLGAWLYCSVKYGFAIPIRPFVLPLEKLGEEARGRYHGEETYIKAIEYIRENFLSPGALSDRSIDEFFGTESSRYMVKDYLGKLIHLLEDEKLEKTFQNDGLPYFSESSDLFNA